MYSIVIPYLSNSKYIDKCKYYLHKNKSVPFELIEIVDETDVYYAYNYGVYKAKYDKVILLNDDMIVSKNWDFYLLKHSSFETITMGQVVEPDPKTIYRDGQPLEIFKSDCGLSIDSFDYEKFQTYVDSLNYPEVTYNSKGYYQPICFDKKSFISFPNRIKFPFESNDVLLIDHILPWAGYKFAKVKSFVYHFQSQARNSEVV